MTDRPSMRTRTPAYPPMTQAGYDGLRQYLKATIERDADPMAPVPDTELLRQGLPHGSILHITPDLGIQVRNTEDETKLRSPRFLGTLGTALARALLLPGGSMGLNRKNINKPDRRDYLHYRAVMDGKDFKVPMLRIIADTQPGYQTPSAANHLSYRREDLPNHTEHVSSRQLTVDGIPTKAPYRGRRLALQMAMRCFDSNRDKLGFEISMAEYRGLLQTIFSCLDKVALKGT